MNFNDTWDSLNMQNNRLEVVDEKMIQQINDELKTFENSGKETQDYLLFINKLQEIWEEYKVIYPGITHADSNWYYDSQGNKYPSYDKYINGGGVRADELEEVVKDDKSPEVEKMEQERRDKMSLSEYCEAFDRFLG